MMDPRFGHGTEHEGGGGNAQLRARKHNGQLIERAQSGAGGARRLRVFFKPVAARAHEGELDDHEEAGCGDDEQRDDEVEPPGIGHYASSSSSLA